MGDKAKGCFFGVFELWTKHVTVPFSGDFGCTHMPFKIVFSWLMLLSYSESGRGCLSPTELAAVGQLFSLCLLNGGFGQCYFCVQELPCRCTEVLLVVCYWFLSSPEMSKSLCWFAAVPRSPGSRFAGTAILWIPAQGRFKWVCAGIEARSGGFELVFAGCLRFCGNAFLKLLCCNVDSGNLCGSTEYLLHIPGWMTLRWWGCLYQLGLRRRRIITEIVTSSQICASKFQLLFLAILSLVSVANQV